LGWLVTIGLFSLMIPDFLVRPDAEITHFGICLNNDEFQPVPEVPIELERFYICGLIEGTTRRNGSLGIRREGRPVLSQDFSEPPGYFFVPVRLADRFTEGRYQVDIGYARRTLVSTQVSIVKTSKTAQMGR
jgi:hypothetical protein